MNIKVSDMIQILVALAAIIIIGVVAAKCADERAAVRVERSE